MGKPISKVAEVRVSGPLAPHADGFRDALRLRGYTPLSAVTQLRLMQHLSGWLCARGFSAAELTESRVGEYVDGRRAAGYSMHRSRRALTPLLDFLAALRVTPVEEPSTPATAVEMLLAGFERYLVYERGLSPMTVSAYTSRARRFVTGYAVDGDLRVLTAADITRAIAAEADRVSVGGVQHFVAAVRALLRYCHVEGRIDTDLSAAALAVTGRRAALLPRGIDDRDAKALLGACDRRRAIGRRDYAVLVLLLRLGLRAGEVAALRLDDIDWRAAEVVVRGKGGRVDRLPLPTDVGGALTGYLQRGRPRTPSRALFVTATAPIGPLTREAVGGIVRRACVRVGIDPIGAHRLRHTTAGRMLRAGVPLTQIGQVLRHHGLVTTAVYCRVDRDSLRSLARPWPTGDVR